MASATGHGKIKCADKMPRLGSRMQVRMGGRVAKYLRPTAVDCETGCLLIVSARRGSAAASAATLFCCGRLSCKKHILDTTFGWLGPGENWRFWKNLWVRLALD